MNNQDKKYYELMGISPTATPEEIGKAYRALALEYHPDTSGLTKEEAEKKFRELTDAYTFLLSRSRNQNGAKTDNGDQMSEVDFGELRDKFFARLRSASSYQEFKTIILQEVRSGDINSQRNPLKYIYGLEGILSILNSTPALRLDANSFRSINDPDFRAIFRSIDKKIDDAEVEKRRNKTSRAIPNHKVDEEKVREAQEEAARKSKEREKERKEEERRKQDEQRSTTEKQENAIVLKKFDETVASAESLFDLRLKLLVFWDKFSHFAFLIPDLKDSIDDLNHIEYEFTAAKIKRQFWKKSSEKRFVEKGFDIIKNLKIRERVRAIYVEEMKKILRNDEVYGRSNPDFTPFVDIDDYVAFLRDDIGTSPLGVDKEIVDNVYREIAINGIEIAQRLKAMADLLDANDFDWDQFIDMNRRSGLRNIPERPQRLTNFGPTTIKSISTDYVNRTHTHAGILIERKIKDKLKERFLNAKSFSDFQVLMEFFEDDELDEMTGYTRPDKSVHRSPQLYKTLLFNAVNMGLEQQYKDLRWNKNFWRQKTDIKSSVERENVVAELTRIQNPGLVKLIVKSLERGLSTSN